MYTVPLSPTEKLTGIAGLDDDDENLVSNELATLSSAKMSSVKYKENNMISSFSRSRE